MREVENEKEWGKDPRCLFILMQKVTTGAWSIGFRKQMIELEFRQTKC